MSWNKNNLQGQLKDPSCLRGNLLGIGFLLGNRLNVRRIMLNFPTCLILLSRLAEEEEYWERVGDVLGQERRAPSPSTRGCSKLDTSTQYLVVQEDVLGHTSTPSDRKYEMSPKAAQAGNAQSSLVYEQSWCSLATAIFVAGNKQHCISATASAQIQQLH
jgi:hypothetical protein